MVRAPLRLRVDAKACLLAPSCSHPPSLPQLQLLQGRRLGVLGNVREGRGGTEMFMAVGWRYPSLLGPLRLESELSTTLAQSAEDTCVDEKGASY